MNNTVTIELLNPKAEQLIHELEDLKIIKIVRNDVSDVTKSKRSSKYCGFLTKEDGADLRKHVIR